MDHEFEINMKLRKMDAAGANNKDEYKEDRKDQRVKMQASQQSAMIDQKNNGGKPKDFESSGNDVLNGGVNSGGFGPR